MYEGEGAVAGGREVCGTQSPYWESVYHFSTAYEV